VAAFLVSVPRFLEVGGIVSYLEVKIFHVWLIYLPWGRFYSFRDEFFGARSYFLQGSSLTPC